MSQGKFEQRAFIAKRLFEETTSDLTELQSLGMERVARVQFLSDRMEIKFAEGEIDRSPGVYAFLADQRVVRVGSSAKGVPTRLKQYPRHINNALELIRNPQADLKTPAPAWEARLWKYIFGELAGGSGEIWARISKPCECEIGPVPAQISCKVEESLVADKFVARGLKQPVLNRSSRIM